MSSYTVIPNSYTDPATGEEIVSYEDAYIDNGSHRQQVREAYNRDNNFNDNLYYERPDGSIGHRYADLDPERYETYEQDYVEEVDAEDYLASADITPEDAEYLTDIVGGNDAYETMLRWAANNMSQDFQDNFDAVIQSSDIGDMEEVIQALYEAWCNNRTDEDDYISYDNSYDDDDEEEEGYDDDAPVEIDVSPEFLQAVEDNYPDYGDAIQWAAEFLDEGVIDQFDNTIDYGTLQQKAEAIDWLMNNFRTHN